MFYFLMAMIYLVGLIGVFRTKNSKLLQTPYFFFVTAFSLAVTSLPSLLDAMEKVENILVNIEDPTAPSPLHFEHFLGIFFCLLSIALFFKGFSLEGKKYQS